MNLTKSRAAAQDAPHREDFERLIQATNIANAASRKIEDKFIVYGGGRLTLRSAELLHLHGEWLDRDRKIIRIPPLDSCRCAYCKERATVLSEKYDDLSYEEVLDSYWQPKTAASERAIPYGFSQTAIDIVETFVDEVGCFDYNRTTHWRRVKTLQERAGISKVYPHALRAAAAFFWANLGLEAVYLLSIMGWKDLRVAVHYIQASGAQLNERVKQLVDNANQKWFLEDPDALPDPAEAVYSMTNTPHPRSPSPNLNTPVQNNSEPITKTKLQDFGFVCDD